MAKTKATPEETTTTPQTPLRKPEVVVITSGTGLDDWGNYRDHFVGVEPGVYRVEYSCPLYTMNAILSWDGETLK
jgi:hypothetical protein